MIDLQMQRDIANTVRRALPLSSLAITTDRSATHRATDFIVRCLGCGKTVGAPGVDDGNHVALNVSDTMTEDAADPSLAIAADLLANLRAHPCGCTWRASA